MAKPEKNKEVKKGRTNMVSSRKDFDKVYAEAVKEGPEVAGVVAKYFGLLSNSMSKLGWEPKAEETPAEPTEPSPVDEAPVTSPE